MSFKISTYLCLIAFIQIMMFTQNSYGIEKALGIVQAQQSDTIIDANNTLDYLNLTELERRF